MSGRVLERGAMLEGRYRVTYFLGGGGAAQVFLARDTQLDRDVAIKVLHQSLASDARFLRRFRAEGRAVAALDHHHIVKVYDYRQTPNELDVPYLIMEYLGGGNLRAVLDHGPLELGQVLSLGIQAASALAHAARRGVVHRDIKPANLLFGLDGNLKIADFGIARAMSESSITEQHDTLWGTARYMSPEQTQGGTVTDKTDVYSLALVLCEAITGEVPFERENAFATMEARRSSDLVAPAGAGPLTAALEAAGRRDPDERWSARELYDAFIDLSSQFRRPDPIPLAGAIPPEELDAARREAELSAVPGAPAVAAGSAEATVAVDDGAADAAAGAPGDVDDEPSVVLDEEDAEELSDGEWASDDASVPPIDPDPTSPIDPSRDVTLVMAPTSTAPEAATPDATAPDTAVVATAGRDDTAVVPVATGTTGGGGPASGPLADVPRRDGATARVRSAAGPEVAEVTSPVVVLEADGEPEAADEAAPTRSPRLWPWVAASIILVIGLVAGATYWWFELRIPRNPVLNVVGEDEMSAVQSLKDLGFTVTVQHVRRDGTEPNEVIEQDPEAGIKLQEGSTVAIVVSLGNTLVPYPDLPPGQISEDDAVAALEAVELVVGGPERPHDENVAKGNVISATPLVEPDATGQVPKGTVVDLVVSAGPAPRKVPTGLVGRNVDEAKQLLAEVQLGAKVVEEFSDRPVGTVLRLGTPEGSEVARDTVIDVVVSKGPERFPIPNVVGETGSRADEILRAAGFTVSAVNGSPSAKVVAQDPAAGSMHVKGTSVRLLTNG